MDNWQLPIDWDWKTLPEICEITPKRPRLQRADDVPTSFVPMQAVDDIEGKIVGMETRRYEEVKRGYTYFEENDVLMAKITPSMENGKAAIAQNLIDGLGFGTTEFHVFRPKEGILPTWIFYFIRRLSFRLEAKSHFRGAVGQQRVPEDFLKTYEIPIPFPNDPARSLETQKRIVLRLETLLGEVKSARELQESIEEDANQVVDRVLLEVFDAPHPKWGNNNIRDITIGKPQYGLSAALSEEPTGVPVLRMGNIQNGKINLNKLKYVELSQSEIRKYSLKRGDIVFNRTNSAELVGKTAVVDFDEQMLFASYLVRLQVDESKVKPKFVSYYINSPVGRRYIENVLTRAIGQVNVNAQKLIAMPIAIPPTIEEQQKIINYIDTMVDEVGNLHTGNNETGELLNQLEQSLLAQAFRGEL